MPTNTQILIAKKSSQDEIAAVVKRIMESGGGFIGIASSNDRGECSCADPMCKNVQPKEVEVFISNLTPTQIAQSVFTLIGHCGDEAGNLILENIVEILGKNEYPEAPIKEKTNAVN